MSRRFQLLRAQLVRTWPGEQYWLAILPALPVLLLRFFYPEILENEAGKLIEARRMFDASFLSRDWLQANSGEDVLYRAFSALVAPLWLLLKNAILVVLLGRLLLWALLLYALVRLARTLGIERYALAIGLAAWLFGSQTMGANEWIFGGIEGKCVAYAFVFLALESALRKKVLAAALWCGLAIWMHVLVGGWAAMALGGALLLGHRDGGWRRALQFCAINAAFLLPLAAQYLRGAAHAEPGGSSREADALVVLFRNPHHIDPRYFHGGREFVLLCLMAAATVYTLAYALRRAPLSRSCVGRSSALPMRWFLFILLAQFAAGLIARSLDAFWFLKYYPFRVADVLVPLLFWLTVPMLPVWISRQGTFARWPPKRRAAAWCVLVVLPVAAVAARSLPAAGRHLAVFAQSWTSCLRHQSSPWQQATEWIRLHTPESAVIIAPPWEGAFWIEAERAEMVNYKRPPHSRAILEWYARMQALNGGAFHERGADALDELQQNYAELDAASVAELGERYGADYFLATRELSPVPGELVYRNSEYFLYRLKP